MVLPFLPPVKPKWSPTKQLSKQYGSNWAWFRPAPIKETRRNMILNSEDLTQSSWAKTSGSYSGGVFTNSTSPNYITCLTTSGHTSGTSYTIYVEAKAGTESWIQIPIHGGLATGNLYANFNVATGTIGNKSASVVANIIASTNGYYICSITVTANVTGSGGSFYLWSIDDANDSFGGTSTSGRTTYIRKVWMVPTSLADQSYQPIGASWDATYTAKYPGEVQYQDSAGSTAVTAAAQSVGKLVDYKDANISAIQATTANKPTYYTDARAVPVLRHDTTDGLTATLPAGFSGLSIAANSIVNSSNWNPGSGVAISTGQITFTNSTGYTTTLTQVLRAGYTYKVTYTIQNYSAGSYAFYNSGWKTERTANGTYTEIYVVTVNSAAGFGNRGVAGSCEIVNVTIEEVSASASLYYANQWGVQQLHSLPIYDSYALPGKPGSSTADDVYGYIILPSRPDAKTEAEIVKWMTRAMGGVPRRNLAVWTENLQGSVGYTTNSVTIESADTIRAVAGNSGHSLYSAVSFSTANATQYTMSVSAKAGTAGFLQLFFWLSVSTIEAYANFNLSTGELGRTGTGATATIESEGNGWYRCTLKFTTTASGASAFQCAIRNAANTARNAEWMAAGTETIQLRRIIYMSSLEADQSYQRIDAGPGVP